MHYGKESHAVFSLFKLQQTPLFLLLLLFPHSSGSAITCAFSKHQHWDEGQRAAGGSHPNIGMKPRLLPVHRGYNLTACIAQGVRGNAAQAEGLKNPALASAPCCSFCVTLY